MKRFTIQILLAVLGRRRLVRFARMLTNAARLDVANERRLNGEMRVVETVLQHAPKLNAPPVVVDCGAHVGHYVIEVSKRAAAMGLKEITLHTFEPASATLATLRKNLAAELPGRPVVINPCALSDRSSGHRTLHIVHDNAGVNSLLPCDLSPAAYTETVPVTTLDDYCAAAGLHQVLLLKIDTEGNDHNVLLGARGLLTRGAVAVVQFEYNYRWIYARKYLRDVFELAAAIGMALGKVTPRGIEFYSAWHPELETFVEGNYLLCRPEWKARFPVVAWWGQGIFETGNGRLARKR